MKVTVDATVIPEVLLFQVSTFGDHRGRFMEAYRESIYQELGLHQRFVQDNVSTSSRGVLRGLHCQNPNAQGKLVYAAVGSVFDVAVDVRYGSPTFGKWAGAELSADNGMQLYVPPGFAHGFVVLSDIAVFCYKCTDYYDKISEFAVKWNDPDIGIQWPVSDPILSEKDGNAPLLRDVPVTSLQFPNDL